MESGLAAEGLRALGIALTDKLQKRVPKAGLTTGTTIPKANPVSDLLNEIFDEHYYLAQSPSLKTAAISPLEHYQTTGWRDGRNPHPLFDTAWYLKNNADVAALGCEPLEHYRSDGWRKGLSPGPLFDSKWYLKAYQDVAESGVEPLGHYLRYGIREGRFPRSIDMELAGLSDRDFARWADRHCTRFLSQTTEEQRIHPDRETAINDLREALAAAAVELPPKVSIIVAARDRCNLHHYKRHRHSAIEAAKLF